MSIYKTKQPQSTAFHQECQDDSMKKENSAWENSTATYKRMKLDPNHTPHTKFNSKLVKDLIIRAKTIKLLGEHIENKLHNTGFGSDFLDTTQKHRKQKKQ